MLGALLDTLGTDIQRFEIREYVITDYLLLHALVGDVIYLLAINHHKQLSFDINLKKHCSPTPPCPQKYLHSQRDALGRGVGPEPADCEHLALSPV